MIAYCARAGVRTVALDGTGAEVLIASDEVGEFGQIWRASWSPDGRYIAYARISPPTSAGYLVPQIWVADADGANQHVVARGYPRAGASNPAWSPDGRRLAYDLHGELPASVRQGTWVMRRDGTHKRWLHRGQDPSSSADGKLIAVRRGIRVNGLAVMRPDGTGYRRLGYGHSTRWLEFSPTNPTQLAYMATGKYDPATGHADPKTKGVFILDVKRGINRQIPPERSKAVGDLRFAAATWTPNGRRLAFIERSTYLSTIRRNGSHKRRLLTLPGSSQVVPGDPLGYDLSWQRKPSS